MQTGFCFYFAVSKYGGFTSGPFTHTGHHKSERFSDLNSEDMLKLQTTHFAFTINNLHDCNETIGLYCKKTFGELSHTRGQRWGCYIYCISITFFSRGIPTAVTWLRLPVLLSSSGVARLVRGTRQRAAARVARLGRGKPGPIWQPCSPPLLPSLLGNRSGAPRRCNAAGRELWTLKRPRNKASLCWPTMTSTVNAPRLELNAV